MGFDRWRGRLVAQRNDTFNGCCQLVSVALFSERRRTRKNNEMEFPFDINIVLPLETTILNGDYRILNHGHTARILYVLNWNCFSFGWNWMSIFDRASDKLTSIIDAIGDASYKVRKSHVIILLDMFRLHFRHKDYQVQWLLHANFVSRIIVCTLLKVPVIISK